MSWKNILKYKGEETYNKDEYSGLAPEDTPDMDTIYPKQIEVKRLDGEVYSYKPTKAKMLDAEDFFAEITYTSEDGEDVVFDGLFIEMLGTGSDVENSDGKTVGKLHSNHSIRVGKYQTRSNLRWFDVKRLV
tara:strand:- start:51 stop:446 length:396 start_codon:yes stop_codon:yes gene_type:complete